MEAEDFADRKNIEFENKGAESLEISTATRLVAQEAELALLPYGKSLKDAVDFYLVHLKRVSGSKTVKDAVGEFLTARRTQKRILSVRYLNDLKNRLGKFVEIFGSDLVASVSGADIEKWLQGRNISGVTHDNYHRILSVFFEWAQKTGLIDENPINGIRDPEPVTKAPGIFSPLEAEALLRSAPDDILPYLAFSLFCGIRPEEFQKTVIRRKSGQEFRETISLDWDNVDLRQKIIVVPAEMAKTRRRRVVTLPENLLTWIAPLSQCTGAIAPSRFREKLEKHRKEISLKKWPHDVLRHSFCTYHIALHQNEHLTAQQAGNSPQILRAHYDAVATPEEGRQYFAIQRMTVGNVIRMAA